MQKIIVQNFKALRDVKLEIPKTLLFIGEQATGKSTLAKLIYFFKSLIKDYETLITNIEQIDPSTIEEAFNHEISRKFSRLFGSMQQFLDSSIEYFFAGNKSIQLQIVSVDTRPTMIIRFLPKDFNDALTIQIMPLLERWKPVYNHGNITNPALSHRLLDELTQYTQTLFAETRIPMFIPASRNMATAFGEFFKQELFGRLSSYLTIYDKREEYEVQYVQDAYLMLQFLRYVSAINEFKFKGETFATLSRVKPANPRLTSKDLTEIQAKIEHILKGQYELHPKLGEIIRLKQKEAYIDLNNASTGQQEAIRIIQDLFLTMVDGNSVFRVIEEPEAHLFPTAQKHLLELMSLMLNRTDSQLILTTHSPYILSVMNNLLFRFRVDQGVINEDSTSAYFLNPSETGVYVLKNGECHSLISPKTDMIDQNALDSISEDLGDEFEELYEKFAQGLIK